MSYIDDEFKMLAGGFGMKKSSVSQQFIEKRVFDYTDKIPIGISREDDSIMKLNISKSMKALILGSTGGGKSWLMGDIFSRHCKRNSKIVIIDVKGEFLKSYLPIQSDFAKFLLRDEKPEGFSTHSFYPYFFKKATDYKKEDNEEYCQYNMDNLGFQDLVTLFGDSSSTAMADTLEDIFSSADLSDLDSLKDALDEYKDATQATKNKIMRTIRNFFNSGILGSDYSPPDIVKSINENQITILNLKGYTKFTQYAHAAATYIALFMREIYNAKVEGRLPKNVHIVLVLDEINRYILQKVTEGEILKMVDLSRSEKISMLMSSQDVSRISETIMKQSQYVFLSKTNTLSDMAFVIKEKLPEEYETPQTFKSEVAFLYRGMKYHDWLFLNTRNSTKTIINPLPPLCFKAEEGDDD